MNFKCKNCNESIDVKPLDNFIIFCPNCKTAIGSVSNFGYGSIEPCTIFKGNTPVGVIKKLDKEYYLISDVYGINLKLNGGYKNLECYAEASKIVKEYL